MIIKELIPYIDSHYRTIPKREARVIEGFSMGGFGALKFAFKYPELFCSVVGGSPVLLQWERMSTSSQHIEMAKRMFANDAKAFESERPTTWLKKNADKIRGKVCIRIVIGDQDRLKPYNDALCKLLDELKIPYQYEVLEGLGHSGDKVYPESVT
jgi:endo-1,4-beta-xylanase